MEKFVELFASNLELFLNVLEFIALIISVCTVLFFMLNKYNKGLKLILGPCGLGFRARMKILFICRNSALKKRAFIEFALLKTQGCSTLSGEWKTVINEFKTFYAENKSDLVYTIPNCTALIGANFSAATARYFDFINSKKVKKALGIREENIAWVVKIHIEEAYATPTCLLTGLLSKYEENWEEFIKRYVSTAYITDGNGDAANNIITSELYYTFDWLLWGPSYELDYKKYWAGLCQLSYGDESNSVPAVADRNSDVIEKLCEKFKANEDRRYGALVSADVTLYAKKEYYKSIREFTNPENLYFYDKIENGEFSFAVQIDSFTPCLNFKSKKYYSTAYVWVMFEVEDESSPDFRPEKCVSFFEHANLTDKDAYNFLIGTLIDKSLKHFEDVFSKPEYKGRKYRFVTALNDKIATECERRYAEIIKSGSALGKRIKERVIMQSKRTPALVFSAFDDFFAQSNDVNFTEVNLHDKSTVSDLAQFYTEVYLDCFPNADERESFDSLINYLKLAEGQSDYNYHVLLAKDNEGAVVGGAVFDYFKRTNSGVIEFIAVNPNLQACGKGTAIYKKILETLAYDANKNKCKTFDNVFCEVEYPAQSAEGLGKHLYFWNKNNYKMLEFNYIQPALSLSQQPVTGLRLIVTAAKSVQSFPKDTLLKVVYDYLKFCMQIAEPEKCAEFIQMKSDLEGKQEVALNKIIA